MPSPGGFGLRGWLNAGVGLAFVGGYAISGNLLTASWIVAGVSLLALAVGWAVERRVPRLPPITAGFSLLTAALASVLGSAAVIEYEMTVRSLVVGLGLLASLALGINVLELAFGAALRLPPAAWRLLALRYALFCLAIAVLNVVVLLGLGRAAWVWWKFPGQLALHGLFLLFQLPLLGASRREASDGPRLGEGPERHGPSSGIERERTARRDG